MYIIDKNLGECVKRKSWSNNSQSVSQSWIPKKIDPSKHIFILIATPTVTRLKPRLKRVPSRMENPKTPNKKETYLTYSVKISHPAYHFNNKSFDENSSFVTVHSRRVNSYTSFYFHKRR